jgi:hypothetical protein
MSSREIDTAGMADGFPLRALLTPRISPGITVYCQQRVEQLAATKCPACINHDTELLQGVGGATTVQHSVAV